MSLTETWCRAYTLLVPADEGRQRQAEIRSHAYDARAAGLPPTRLALQAILGVGADLVWTDRVRRRLGLSCLVSVPFLDPTVGAIVAGALMLVTFAITALPGHAMATGLTQLTSYLAVVAVSSGHVAAALRRLRGRRPNS